MTPSEIIPHLAAWIFDHVADQKVADKMKDIFCAEPDYWIDRGWMALHNVAHSEIYPITEAEQTKQFFENQIKRY
jgi:hypothetical protein